MAQNLKVGVSADTSDFSKKMEAAKKTAKDFGGTVEGVADSLGGAFSGPAKAVVDLAGKFKALAGQFDTAGLTGEAAAKKASAAFVSLGGAIAGLGLAAVVAAFKQLNAQADIFFNTTRGERLKSGLDAYTSTLAASVSEQTGSGEWWAGAKSQAEKFWAYGKQYLATSVMDGFKSSGMMFGLSSGLVAGITKTNAAIKEANAKAEQAEAIAGEIYDINLSILESTGRWKAAEAEVAELKGVASDQTKTIAERTQALTSAMAKQRALGDEQVAAYTRLAELVGQRNALTESGTKEINEQVQAEGRAADAQKHAADTLKEMQGIMSGIKSTSASIAKEWEANVAAAMKTAEAAMAGVQAEMDKIFEARERMESGAISAVDGSSATGRADNKATVVGGLEVDQAAADKTNKWFTDMADNAVKASESFRTAVVDSMGGSFEYLFDCMAGLEEFNGAGLLSAVLTPFAELAIKIGEILVSSALASDSLKTLIATPKVALAAGAALIAVGYAAKAGLSAAVSGATGSSYVSSATATSGYSSGSQSSESWEREMKLEVSGTLTADGDKLVAVLNNTANRKAYTA